MGDVPFFTFILISSLLLTELIRRYSLKKNLLDTPNERSSHTSPTPRGGGLSFVIIFLVAIGFTFSLHKEVVYALMGAGTLVAVVGFWDDQNHIAARWRLLSHFIAAAWALYWLGGLPEFHLFGLIIDAGWVGLLVTTFILVWLLNLFNFMDGIDGIAASETIFIASAGAYFSWLNGFTGLTFITLILAAATTGFLILNWSPAKIFMGDVGSGFLGLMLGIIAYANIIQGGSAWSWSILFAVFLVDSGVTLLRRIIKGDKWYEAHCSHAYQHAARKWGHKKVTVSVILINLIWLFPLAVISQMKPNIAFWLSLLAFVPLMLIALKLKAGISVVVDS